MARKKTKVPENETKRDKFKRIVQPRVRKALKTIRLIGNCSGAAYEYKPKDVADIITSLRSEIEQLEKSYASKGVAAIEFDLD